MREESVARWVKEHLIGLDVDEDTLGDYITSIVADETDDVDSRMSVVESILSGSTEKACDITSFLADLSIYLQTDNAEVEDICEPEIIHEDVSNPSSLRSQVNKERMEAQKQVKERKEINVTEMKQREKLLNTYGFDAVEMDEDGNLIYREKKKETDSLEGVNENALRVKMAEKIKRETMKIAHDSETKRNKELETKRKADKEKKKSVKQERKGRGGFM